MIFNEELSQAQANSLLTSAEIYLALGWPGIPTHGKVAAVPWKQYQHRRPTQEELQRWFIHDGYTGLAIICGRLSALAVLDFDDLGAFNTFKAQHPHLADTRTVQTRHGVHLYFQVPPYLRLSSCHAPGVDLQYEGTYVVAPPSVGYQLVKGGLPRPLTQPDAEVIQRFITACQNKPAEIAENPLNRVAPRLDLEGAHTREAPQNAGKRPTTRSRGILETNAGNPAPLRAVYWARWGQTGSRNQALFQAACYAHARGFTQETVEAVILGEFVHSKAPHSHKRETAQSRRREGQATIRSAYNRETVCFKANEPGSLPAAAHQALSRRRETAAARMLDSLYKNGVKPGQPITRQVMERVDTSHGRKQTVKFLESSGLSALSKLPPNPPQKPAHAEKKANAYSEKQNEFCSLAKSPKTPNVGGRPMHTYTLPSPLEVCRYLGIGYLWQPPLTLADLEGKIPLRLALLRDLLTRTQGKKGCTITWQARVFGVHPATVRRWHTLLGVVARYPGRTLSRYNLPFLFKDEQRVEHCWVQDPSGRRYPAQKVVVARLWKQGQHGLTLHNRHDPRYYLPENAPESVLHDQPLQRPSKTQPEATETWKGNLHRVYSETPRPDAPAPVPRRKPRQLRLWERFRREFAQPDPIATPRPWTPKWGRGMPGTPLADKDLEAKAQHLYNELNTRARPDKRVKADLVRRWVVTYGFDRVRAVIKQVTGSHRNPVGFVRSELEKGDAAPG